MRFEDSKTARIRAMVAASMALVALLPGDVLGCGDKFLVPGRGVRFPSTLVNRAAAAVLLYARSGSGLERTITSLSVDARLRTAGYRPAFVTSEAAFDSVLRAAAWDVVVVEIGDVADVQSRLPPASSTVVLAVVSDAATTLPAAMRAHPQILKLPRRDRAFVEALDKVLAAQARAGKKVRGA